MQYPLQAGLIWLSRRIRSFGVRAQKLSKALPAPGLAGTRLRTALLVSGLLWLASAAQAATITWTNAAGTGDWNTPGNWSSNTVPGTTDDVVFSATSAANASLSANTAIKSLNISSAYTGVVSFNTYNVSIGGSLAVAATGALNAGTSTVTITAASTVNCAAPLYNLTINAPGSNIAFGADLQVNQNFTLTAVNNLESTSFSTTRTLRVSNSSNGSVVVNSSWTRGSNPAVVLTIDGSATFTGTGNVTALAVNSGSTLSLLSDLKLAGFLSGAGNIRGTSNKVRVVGASTLSLSGAIDNLEIAAGATNVSLGSDLQVDQDFTLTSVNVLESSSFSTGRSLRVKGSVVVNSTWAGGSNSAAVLTFNGSTDQTFAGTANVTALAVSKTGGDVLLNNDLKLAGSLAGAGLLKSVSGTQVRVLGASTLTFTGTVDNLEIAAGTSGISLGADLQVNQNFTLTSVNVLQSANFSSTRSLRVGGAMTVNSTWAGGSNPAVVLTFNGGADQTFTGTANVTALAVSKTGGDVLLNNDLKLAGSLSGAGLLKSVSGTQVRVVGASQLTFTGTIDNLEIAAGTANVVLGADLQVNQNFTLTSVNVFQSGNFSSTRTLRVGGNTTINSTWAGGSNPAMQLALSGSSDQTLAATVTLPNLTIAKTAGRTNVSSGPLTVTTFRVTGYWNVSGATLTTASIPVQSGATLTGAGTLNGNLTLNSGSTFNVDIDAAATPLLTVNGTVSISGATLTGSVVTNLSDTQVILENDLADAIAGTRFTGATTNGALVTLGGFQYLLSYIGGTGNDLTLMPVLPTVTSFTPTRGPWGTSVVITGTNLTGATAVSFGGTVATAFTVNSATQITATVPVGAATGIVSVTTPAGTGSSAASFVVDVAPTALALSSTRLAENVAAATAVGTFSTTDANAGDTFTYMLVSGTGSTDNAAFTITGNSLFINTSPNFEGQNSYSIRVRTTDQTGLSFEQTFTISVTDVNEAPTALALSSNSLAENVAAGTTVGAFSITDPDAANTFTYALVSGTGSTDNAAFTLTGNTLAINASPDFEAQSSYSIRVRTTDQGGLSFIQVFTVTITNENELVLSGNQTNANCGISNGSASVSASGEAGPYTYSWSPAGLNGGSTATVTGLGAGTYSVLVTSTPTGFTATRSFTITSTPDATLPVVLTRNATLALNANGRATLTAAAVDNGSSDNCSIASMSVSPSSFTCANVGTPVTVTLTVTDASGNQSTGTATVTVVDNTAPTVYCQPITRQLNASGQVSITAADLVAPPVVGLAAGVGSLGQGVANDVVAGDLDGDGDKDVVYAMNGQSAVYLNDGTGTFAPHPTTPLLGNSSDNHHGVALGDIDGDGDLDLVFAVFGGNETVYVNNGSGSFTLLNSFAGLVDTYDVALADIDGDGDLDAAVNNISNIQLWRNNGSGVFTFTGNTLAGGGHLWQVQFARLDADARPDLLVSGEDGRAEWVFLNNGTGTFALHPTTPSFGGGSFNLTDAVGDVDGDGDLDVAYTNGSTVVVWYNANNTGAFTTSQTFPMAQASNDILLVDMENDGDLDIVAGSGPLQVLLNNGSGSFTAQANTANAGQATVYVMVAADFNGDGLPDVVTGRWLANTAVNYFRNNTTRTADVCSGLTLTASQLNFTCANRGNNTVTLTATDASGNSSSCQAVVTIQDAMAPTAVAQNVTVSLGANGSATLLAAAVNNGSSDNCTPANLTLSVSPSSFTCANLGANPVTLTVTDASGNASTATATVTVVDNTAPVVITRNTTLTLSALGRATLTAAAVNNGSSDNCTAASSLTLSVSPRNFTCANVGPNTVTLTVTDANGNQATATAIVTVVDNTAPSLFCQPITRQLDANGQVTITPAELVAPTVPGFRTATGSFGTAVANDLAVGDLDGDGDADVVYANNGQSAVYLNNGSGTFTLHPTTPLLGATTDTHRGVALGDVDGDGDLDLVFAVVGGNETVYANDGSGNFALLSSFAGLAGTYDVALADIDGDGDLDAAVNNIDNIQLWRNNGSGVFTFTGNTLAGGGHLWQVQFARLNADARPDLLVSGEDGRAEWVFLNNGTGTFALHPTTPAFGGGSFNLTDAVGDVDGDGDLDVAYPNGNSVVVWYNANNTGAFTTSQTFSTAQASNDIVMLDMENDGDLDIVVGTGPLQILINNGAGSFTALSNLGNTAVGVMVMGAADFDGDGYTDVVTGRWAANIPANFSHNSTTRSFDQCSGMTLSASKLTFDCSNRGNNTVTLTATDASGNAATCQAVVTIQDAMAPTAVAQNVTVTLGANGTATLTAAQVDNGSSDNCGIVSRSISPSTFTCANVGPGGTLTSSGTLRLSASASQYVLSDASAGISGNTTGTFETWIRTTANNPMYGAIIATSTAADGGSGSYMTLRWNGGGRVACEGLWSVAQTGTSPALNDGQWHHVAAVGDGSTCKLYIDGVLDATGSVGAGQTYFRRIMLGAERSRTPGYFTTVELDNSRVWSVARSAAQVLDGKDNTTPADVTGLLLAYTYEQGSGSTLTDASGNNRPATLYSGTTQMPTWDASGRVTSTTPDKLVILTVTDAAGNTRTAAASVTVLAPSVASVPTLTWTGAANTNWSDCGNWSYGLMPAASQNVSIPAGLSRYPVLNAGTATVNNLTIATGASFTLSSGATLEVSGNLANSGPALAGTVRLVGTGAQSLASTFGTLVVDKPSGSAALAANVSVNTALTLTNGGLSTSTYTLTLAPAATITESATSYVTGTVQTTRPVSTAGTAQSFGGLGLTLLPDAASTALPGNTLVKRVTGSPVTGVSGRQGIARYFDIQPAVNSGLNVTLTLSYLEAELNGIEEANLALFKSETGAANTWGRQRYVTLNTTANTASVGGVRNFSIWTLGDANNPLPVQLAAFTVQAEGSAARLKWTTASEKNNAYFDVERSFDGQEFAAIGQVQGRGTSSAPTDYTFRDGQLPAAGTVYYRLRQVDTDGSFSFSPVRSLTLAAPLATALVVYPTEALPGQPQQFAYTGPALPANTQLEVYDATGRLLRQQLAGDANGLVPVNGLQAGWYWVRLHTATGVLQARFYRP